MSYGHPNSHITDKRTVREQSKGAHAQKARKLAGNVSVLILPLFLDKPEFRKALVDWQDHKRAKRDPLTQRALEFIVADCEKWGLEKSIQYIHNAIKSGWKGIYESDSPARPNNGNIRPKSDGRSPKPSQEDLLSRQPEAVRKAIEEDRNP